MSTSRRRPRLSRATRRQQRPSTCSSASPCPTRRALRRSARRSRSWQVATSHCAPAAIPRTLMGCSRLQRKLRNHPKIVNMIEASVADMPGGTDGSKGYEIYILMEWCPGQPLASFCLFRGNCTDPMFICDRWWHHRHDEHAVAEPTDRDGDSQALQRHGRGARCCCPIATVVLTGIVFACRRSHTCTTSRRP